MKTRTIGVALFVMSTMTLSQLSSVGSFTAPMGISPLVSPQAEPVAAHWMSTAQGGRIYTGAVRGPVWLEVPPGFTSEAGAEIYIDRHPARDLYPQLGDDIVALNKTLFSRAWEKQGFLVGIYPRVPLRPQAPISLIIEIDPAKLSGVGTSFVGRYYDGKLRRWLSLTTRFDKRSSRVSIVLASHLPRSEYPAFQDRALIALFVK